MFVEEEERVVDSRELFRKFPGHIKQREGMLKLNSIGRKKVKVVDQVMDGPSICRSCDAIRLTRLPSQKSFYKIDT